MLCVSNVLVLHIVLKDTNSRKSVVNNCFISISISINELCDDHITTTVLIMDQKQEAFLVGSFCVHFYLSWYCIHFWIYNYLLALPQMFFSRVPRFLARLFFPKEKKSRYSVFWLLGCRRRGSVSCKYYLLKYIVETAH